MSSLRTRDEQSNIVNNTIVITDSTLESSSQNEENEIITGNNTNNPELPITELSQPAIERTTQLQNDPSLVQMLPPPPYPKDSYTQIPTPSHSRDHITITLTSPPEYTNLTSIITTQPQPQIMSLNNRFSDVSVTNTTNEDTSNHALLNSPRQIKFCKICQESDSSDSSDSSAEDLITSSETYKKGKLISPCKCKGSLQYVHIGCLNQWRHSNVRAEASYRCEVCKYEYRFYRPRIAKIFSSSFTLHFLSLILLLSTIYLVSYIVSLIINNQDPYNPPHHLPGEKYNRWKEIKEIKFLNIRVIEYIIGISILSCLGLLFFIIMIIYNGFSHTRHHYCYLGGCDNTCCLSYGGCTGSDCSGGDCAGICVLFLLLIISIIFMVGFIGAVIAAYLLIQKITTVCLGKVHDRILEVNKD